MDFGSPESGKEFPGLYGLERDPDSDSEAKGSKQLIGKRKDKKEKDIGYAALGDSSGDEEGDGKSPLKGKMGNPFKFSKKEKREKEKQKDLKEKDQKPKDVKEKDTKLKDTKEKHKEEKVREKVKEEKARDKNKEEKLKEKEKLKDEKRDKEKAKEKTKDRAKEEKVKEKVSKEGKEHRIVVKGKADERKKKKKDQGKGKERKKVEPVDVVEEEPIFGAPLAVAVERSKCHDGLPLPAVVRECIDYIEENGLNCEGIYRLSGVKSKVQQLRRSYNGREGVSLWHHEPHTVASLLKLFLRELPEPVLTVELLPQFDAAAALKDPEKRVTQLRALLDRLPDPNRLLVQYMFKHMEHIIKREKINKMNVQNVSLVLSPTMQISHRVLNAFFLYGKILFTGVTIKKYVPPMADGELPSTAEAIAEEIQKQESLLAQLHSELKAGSISRRREEQLWQAQRILTQLKRRQRQVRKPSDPESVRRASEEASATASDPAAATSPQRLGRTVQIINEDNVTVIQIGEKRLSSASGATEPAEPEAADAAAGVTAAAEVVQVEAAPQPAAEQREPAAEAEDTPEPAADSEAASQPEPSLGGENQASFSDLHSSGPAPVPSEPTPAAPAHVSTELSETAGLLHEAILLMLEEEELRSTERELRSRLAAERSEIGRLRDTIQEMETLYKYRTYSVDSSDDSSAAESDDSDTEEELLRRLLDSVRHNQQLEAKNAQLTRAVHEERRICQRRRAEIRYIELLHAGRS